MKTLARDLWNDQYGFLISAELILVATILVLGLVVGLSCLQNALTQELQDLGYAFSSLNQSFGVSGTRGCIKFTGSGLTAYTAGSSFIDTRIVGSRGFASAGVIGDIGYGAAPSISAGPSMMAAPSASVPCESGCDQNVIPPSNPPCTTCPQGVYPAPQHSLPNLSPGLSTPNSVPPSHHTIPPVPTPAE